MSTATETHSQQEPVMPVQNICEDNLAIHGTNEAMSLDDVIAKDNLPATIDEPDVPIRATAALTDAYFNKFQRLAEMMASATCTIPKHLQGNVGDCFAIITQAYRWGFDPWAVAQKTFVVDNKIGYEAQLIMAVINANAPIKGRLLITPKGEWKDVHLKGNDAPDLSIEVSATFVDEDEPRVLEVALSQVGDIRTSVLWESDPRQQLSYLAVKRWARLNCADVMLGVYSQDELAVRDVTPKKIIDAAGGVAGLKEKLKAKKQAEQNPKPAKSPVVMVEEWEKTIDELTSVKMAKDVGKQIAAFIEQFNPSEDDKNKLRSKFSKKIKSITAFDEAKQSLKGVSCEDDINAVAKAVDESNKFEDKERRLIVELIKHSRTLFGQVEAA